MSINCSTFMLDNRHAPASRGALAPNKDKDEDGKHIDSDR